MVSSIGEHQPVVSAPSMVYETGMADNVRRLSPLLRHVEIVLYDTPHGHNIPTREALDALGVLKSEAELTYSVHLPPSLEIAAESRRLKNASIERVLELVSLCNRLAPRYYILHVPIMTPTLTAEPGVYFTNPERPKFLGWRHRAKAGLEAIQAATGLGQGLLVENINYHPVFLEPFWDKHLCGCCLDIGHLLLGGVAVGEVLTTYMPIIREIHLHGVLGWEEHLGLDVINSDRLADWIRLLRRHAFDGILNLEVFSPRDLAVSMQLLSDNGWEDLFPSSPGGRPSIPIDY